eukprot:g11246.t1
MKTRRDGNKTSFHLTGTTSKMLVVVMSLVCLTGSASFWSTGINVAQAVRVCAGSASGAASSSSSSGQIPPDEAEGQREVPVEQEEEEVKKMCGICLEDMDKEDARLAPCGHHEFCSDCLKLQLEMRGYCPTCRGTIAADAWCETCEGNGGPRDAAGNRLVNPPAGVVGCWKCGREALSEESKMSLAMANQLKALLREGATESLSQAERETRDREDLARLHVRSFQRAMADDNQDEDDDEPHNFLPAKWIWVAKERRDIIFHVNRLVEQLTTALASETSDEEVAPAKGQIEKFVLRAARLVAGADGNFAGLWVNLLWLDSDLKYWGAGAGGRSHALFDSFVHALEASGRKSGDHRRAVAAVKAHAFFFERVIAHRLLGDQEVYVEWISKVLGDTPKFLAQVARDHPNLLVTAFSADSERARGHDDNVSVTFWRLRFPTGVYGLFQEQRADSERAGDQPGPSSDRFYRDSSKDLRRSVAADTFWTALWTLQHEEPQLLTDAKEALLTRDIAEKAATQKWFPPWALMPAALWEDANLYALACAAEDANYYNHNLWKSRPDRAVSGPADLVRWKSELPKFVLQSAEILKRALRSGGGLTVEFVARQVDKAKLLGDWELLAAFAQEWRELWDLRVRHSVEDPRRARARGRVYFVWSPRILPEWLLQEPAAVYAILQSAQTGEVDILPARFDEELEVGRQDQVANESETEGRENETPRDDAGRKTLIRLPNYAAVRGDALIMKIVLRYHAHLLMTAEESLKWQQEDPSRSQFAWDLLPETVTQNAGLQELARGAGVLPTEEQRAEMRRRLEGQ